MIELLKPIFKGPLAPYRPDSALRNRSTVRLTEESPAISASVNGIRSLRRISTSPAIAEYGELPQPESTVMKKM